MLQESEPDLRDSVCAGCPAAKQIRRTSTLQRITKVSQAGYNTSVAGRLLHLVLESCLDFLVSTSIIEDLELRE